MSETSQDEISSMLSKITAEPNIQNVEMDGPIPVSKDNWNSYDTLLMFSIVHMLSKGEHESKIDWDIIGKKLHCCRTIKQGSQHAFTSRDCEDRYFQVIRFAESNLKEPQPAFLKREFVIQTITHGLLCASQAREKMFKNAIERFSNLNASESERIMLDSDEVSDIECTESHTRLNSLEVFNEESFSKRYATCFVVDNPVFHNVSSGVTDNYIKRCTSVVPPTYSAREGDTATTSPILIVVDKKKPVHAPTPDNSRTILLPGEYLFVDGISTRTPIDISRNVPTGAPTLSKLLELPPRDRNQPLPQINSLVNETSNSAELASKNMANSAISTLEQQDNSTKLLAALGTTTTAVKISPFTASGSDNPPFTFRLSESPLKAMDEIEIANDYVMESGLISCDNVDTIKVDESIVVPSTITVPRIATDSIIQPDLLQGGLDVKKIMETAQPECQLEKPIAEQQDTLEVFSNKNDISNVKKVESDIDSSINDVASLEAVPCLENSMNEESRAAGPGGSGSSIRNKLTEMSTTPDKNTEIVTSRSKDNSAASHDRKSRGTKRDTPELPSTPVTRHTAKWKTDDSEEKQGKDASTSSSSKRTASRSIGQSDDVVGKSAQRRLFSVRSGTTDVHAPNLRSRRIPTPTPGAAPQEEGSKMTKRSKIPVDEKEAKDMGKVTENMSYHENSAEDIQCNVTLMKTAITCGTEVGKSEDGDCKNTDSSPTKLLDKLEGASLIIKQSMDHGDSLDDETSNSGTDAAVKKRLTRRSVKIGSVIVSNSKDSKADDDEKDDPMNKESKTRHSKTLSRIISVSEESTDKEETLDGKRVTRARAKTSASPSRTRTKSTGSSKAQSKSDAETVVESGEPLPSRATRSRLVVSSGTSSSAVAIESVPVTPCGPVAGTSTVTNTKDEEVQDTKGWKKSMLTLINRIGQHSHAAIFNVPGASEEIAKYKKNIKRPMDLSIIKKNIELGVIKTLSQLERDLNLMFMNLVMYNHLPGMSESAVAGINAEFITYCRELLQEFRTAQKRQSVTCEGSKKDGSDIEMEATEEVKNNASLIEKPSGRKRRNRSISTGNSDEAQQESKRRTLRTSTAAATTATTAWQSARQKKTPSTPDIAVLGRGRQQE